MSEQDNPYESPEAAVVPEKPLLAQGHLTETMLIYLKAASPWMKFVGILGFVVAGLTALWAIFSFALAPLLGSLHGAIGGFDIAGFLGLAVFGVTMMILSLGGAILIFIPSLFLYRFGVKVNAYLKSGTDYDLEQAFRNNKSYWKFFGILCIVYLAFIPVLLTVVVIAAVLTSF